MLWPHPHHSSYQCFLHQLAKRIEGIDRAENKEKVKMVIVNRFDAEPFAPESTAKPEPSDLVKRREDYSIDGEIPEGIVVITMGADTQKDRIEAEFVGWGANRESWGLGYHVIYRRHFQRSDLEGLRRGEA